ncbi:peptidoglycan-binding domain-containing protein, partial [Paracoccus rhizosphaerae]
VHLLCCTLRGQRSGTKPRQVQASRGATTARTMLNTAIPPGVRLRSLAGNPGLLAPVQTKIGIGFRGLAEHEAQERLKAHGFHPLGIDSGFGANTAKAATGHQLSAGLAQDDIMDPVGLGRTLF